MGYRDYDAAPGTRVIIERTKRDESRRVVEYHPCFIGTGMTTRGKTISFQKIEADMTMFETEREVTIAFPITEHVGRDHFKDTEFELLTIGVHQTDPGSAESVVTPLVKGSNYELVEGFTSIRTDGKAYFIIRMLDDTVKNVDSLFDFSLKITNTTEDFKPLLALSTDAYNQEEVFGPLWLKETDASGNEVKILNEIAVAAHIAFQMDVPKFYYLEVPREYGKKAEASHVSDVFEELYFKKNAYRLVPLMEDKDMASKLQKFIDEIANPLDQKEKVAFVSYPTGDLTATDWKSIDKIEAKVGKFSEGLNSSRVNNVFGGKRVWLDIQKETLALPWYYMNVAVACLDTTVGMAKPISRREIRVFKRMEGPRFRPKVWNSLARYGVFIVTQDDESEPIYIRHQLTTSQSDEPEDAEYSITKNLDATATVYREKHDPYAGQDNISDGLIEKLEAASAAAKAEVISMGYVRDMVQVLPWSLVPLPPETPTGRSKTKLATKYRPILSYPANNLDIHLLV